MEERGLKQTREDVWGLLIPLTLNKSQALNANGLVCSWFLAVESFFFTGLSHLPLPLGRMSTKTKAADRLPVVMVSYSYLLFFQLTLADHALEFKQSSTRASTGMGVKVCSIWTYHKPLTWLFELSHVVAPLLK